MSELHVKVYVQMLQCEMDSHLGYEKGSKEGINNGNSRNGSYPKKIQGKHGEAVIEVPRDREGDFEPVVVPKHQSRGLSIEHLVISLYAKGMSVSDIESEMHEMLIIYLIISILYYEYSVDLSIFSNTFKYLIFFNLGILLSDKFLNDYLLSKYSKVHYFLLVIFLFICVEYFYIIQSVKMLYNLLLPSILGITSIILISYIASKKKCFDFLNQLGKYSMEIYILHILVASGTRIILFKFLNVNNAFVHMILGTMLGIIIPFVITLKLKNVKFYTRLFRLK